jgi:magnesium chelatase accessory protein
VTNALSFTQEGRDWPNREASRFVTAAGLTWHVQIMGSGPVVLLVHGTGSSTHSFAELAQILAKAFTVVVPDLPGHAFTSTPPASRLSLPGMSADLAALLDALQLKPDVVVGHSAGAAILIEMCLDGHLAPDAVVSINGALLPFGTMIGRFFSPLAKLLVVNPFVPSLLTWRAASSGAVDRLIRNTGSHVPPESIACYRLLFRNEVHVSAALRMMANWDLERLERRLLDLAVPLVLVVGGNDQAISPEDAFTVRDRVPAAEIVLLRGLGHLAHEERPEEIAEIVIKTARRRLAA